MTMNFHIQQGAGRMVTVETQEDTHPLISFFLMEHTCGEEF